VGFDTLDFGSFVSPKAIPQMKDTAEVLEKLNLDGVSTKLLAIIANKRGAEDAGSLERVDFLGYPFSISETFQKRNTNATIDESLVRVDEIVNIAAKANKGVVIYISMAFGNPYEEYWHPDIAAKWSEKLMEQFGIKIIALSDTIGTANPKDIDHLFSTLIGAFPNMTFGAHLHTTPDAWKEKLAAAYNAGCRRFDGAIKGYGGCPMATDDLTGNMPTEMMLSYFDSIGEKTGIDKSEFEKSLIEAQSVFPQH
jgi:hydroxymethylglutaryl-CoA lyase